MIASPEFDQTGSVFLDFPSEWGVVFRSLKP